MSCEQFPASGPPCRTIQVIAPDPTLLTGSIPGSTDPSIDEMGSIEIPSPFPAGIMEIQFLTPKISENYRFEYLYIDALNIPPDNTHPGIAEVVVTQQTRYGFTVQFAGMPRFPGYFLHWRVVVVDVASTIFIDAPEVIRIQLPQQARQMTVYFTNLRSNETYGFSELRVENLQDDPDTQRIILVQVAEKTTMGFTIGINPRPENTHYFLVARTP